MPSNKVRTRFAPSPTGYMHVGNLRTALYTYLMAKHEGGTFILRIEDTDQGRYVEGAVDVIYNTLRETGLLWDEGPDVGGPVGPYVQSERMGMFKQYAEQLVAEGKAYYCFCTEERLEALHAEQRAAGEMTHYDGCCRELPKEEVEKRLAAGEPYVIRQKIPREGVTGFDDVVYGHIEVNNSEMDDQILIKTDGMPTYNFANVVDDHLMGITHVIRGSEYLSSTPKYNLLYQAFGWDIPTYIHCPPVMKDAQNKLSKRNGDASYQDLVAKGYLTEAVLNYICLLGWSPRGEYAEQEIFSLPELVKIWSPEGISKSPAIFDPLKLRAINAAYIRALPAEEFRRLADPFIDRAVHRDIDRETDVLSFPLGDDENGYEVDPDTDAIMLGDIVISLEKAKQQAEEYGHSYRREVAFLLTHSLFHLLGYDHVNSEEEEKEMFGKQDKVLDKLGITRES